MAAATPQMKRKIRQRFRNCPIKCHVYTDTVVENLSDFFAVFASLLDPDKLFWFRGHSMSKYRLCPSALRYSEAKKRDSALALVSEMRRFLEMKLPRPPAADDHLGWMQVAQHYGIPTRLLDWTQNAAVALFFACCSHLDSDGLVVILNPIELNQHVSPKLARVLNAQADAASIAPYLRLDGRESFRRSKRTIAINPTWNTERIALQQGAFTLHGSRQFDLDVSQSNTLAYVPILRENKQQLLNDLERVGIGEMFIFPEPEHVCAHLRRSAKL